MHRPPSCRVCGGRTLADLGACPHAGDGEPDHLYRCADCGIGQRFPLPDREAIAAMYRDIAADEMDYDYEKNAAWSLTRRKLIARFSAEAPITVLDVGCHTGSFLGGLPKGWSRHGIEGIGEPARVAATRNSVRLIGERIEEVGSEWGGRFDVVTMFDVVEHLPDPESGIGAAIGLLKPGGLLFLSTADLDAWTSRWLGGGHWYMQTPQHLVVLSRKFLHHIAQRHRAQLVEVDGIPHRYASLSTRVADAIKVAYWGMRLRKGGWRIPHRALQSVPGLRHLRHMRSVPWAMTLKDHFLCCFERGITGPP